MRRRSQNEFLDLGDHVVMVVWSKGRVNQVRIDHSDVEKCRPFCWNILNYQSGYKKVATSIFGENHRQKTITLSRHLLSVSASSLVVDHIDHNPLNNRRANLRMLEPWQNKSHQNPEKVRRTKSGIKYATQRAPGQFRAVASVKGKRYGLGVFKTAEEANVAVVAFRRDHPELVFLQEGL